MRIAPNKRYTRMPSGNASVPLLTSRLPQRKRGRDRVASVMNAAAALFVEKGYEATTMTEIAAHASSSIGSLYLFFPTKAALAHAMLTEQAEALSARLDALESRTKGWNAPAIADALFDELAIFLAEHPAYGTLVDLPGDEDWKLAVRSRRRNQIASLFTQAEPRLPQGQPQRLAVIVPQLMRVIITFSHEPASSRGALLGELRDMLSHHLKWPAEPEP
jgi:AcrR family transcriptional regulator